VQDQVGRSPRVALTGIGTGAVGGRFDAWGRRLSRWQRPLAVGITILIALALIPLAIARWHAFDSRGLVGFDYLAHQAFAERFFTTGSMYLPSQLAGPYEARPYWLPPTDVPSLYPPHAIYLFAPFLILPALTWWALPAAAVAYGLWRWRPAPWTWPVLLYLGGNVDSVSSMIAGNATMWLVAGVVGGLLWGWPALLVSIKPSLLPFALVGVRRRAWWVGLVALIVLAIPFGVLWLDYITVVRNAGPALSYSLPSVPFLLLGVVAWFGRTNRTVATRA
jgi:hypothetical protein